MKFLLICLSLFITGMVVGQKKSKESAPAGCPYGFDKAAAKPEMATPTVETKYDEKNPKTNKDWWPNQLDLSLLHQQSSMSNPMGSQFNYRKEFTTVDYFAVKKDLEKVLTESQDWWPADFGNYGPFFIRTEGYFRSSGNFHWKRQKDRRCQVDSIPSGFDFWIEF